VAQYYGPQAMPDGWVALSSLAATGFFLRAAASWPARPAPGALTSDSGQPAPPTRRRWPALAGLTGCLALAALFRPGDAAYLTGALILAVVALRSWRHWLLAACVAGGFAAGAAEWVTEAYLRFGGPLNRLRLAGAEQGSLRPRLAIWDELRALNGPTLCRPCTIGWRYPVLSLWWLALPVLVTLGILAARRGGRGTSRGPQAVAVPGTTRGASSALAAGCGLALAAQYLFGIGYAVPRFLLPAYALLAVPVADCLAWLLTGVRPGLRTLTVPAVTVALLAQLTAQQLVLAHEVRGTVTFHQDYQRIVADLHRFGVQPPWLIKGEQDIPIAYDAGYARHWRRRRLPGTRILKLVAYASPSPRLASGPLEPAVFPLSFWPSLARAGSAGLVAVAHAGLVQQMPRPGGVRLQLPAQPGHVEPQVVAVALSAGPPDLGEQPLSADQLAGVAQRISSSRHSVGVSRTGVSPSCTVCVANPPGSGR